MRVCVKFNRLIQSVLQFDEHLTNLQFEKKEKPSKIYPSKCDVSDFADILEKLREEEK